jgi:hypothetical protein
MLPIVGLLLFVWNFTNFGRSLSRLYSRQERTALWHWLRGITIFYSVAFQIVLTELPEEVDSGGVITIYVLSQLTDGEHIPMPH